MLCKDPRINKSPQKHNKCWRTQTLKFQACYKPTVIKRIRNLHKDRQIDQQNRKECPEIGSIYIYIYVHLSLSLYIYLFKDANKTQQSLKQLKVYKISLGNLPVFPDSKEAIKKLQGYVTKDSKSYPETAPTGQRSNNFSINKHKNGNVLKHIEFI